MRSLMSMVEDYSGMFTTVHKAMGPYDDDVRFPVDQYVKWAKKNLRKNDRIIWFLRFVRLKECRAIQASVMKQVMVAATASRKSELGDNDPKLQGVKRAKELIDQIVDKYRTEWQTKSGDSSASNEAENYTIERVQEILLHYLSYEARDQKFGQLVFQWQSLEQLFDQFKALEKDFLDRKSQVLDLNDDDKVVMEFGDGFEWVLLDRMYCSAEGDAMGHCGNTGNPQSGDRILSLRARVKHDGKDVWRPSLTFILNKNGFLGEMKGRNNNKPDVKYHKYIVALLKNPMIKGVAGGGYKPENNFMLSDLPETEQLALYEEKPALAPISWRYKTHGISKSLVEDTVEWIKANFESDFVGADFDNNVFVTYKFANINAFLERFADKNAKRFVEQLEDGFHDWDFETDHDYEERVAQHQGRDFLNGLRIYTKQNCPEDVADWEEDNEEDFVEDVAPLEDVLRILRDNDDEVAGELKWSVVTGFQHGAEREAWKQIETEVTDDMSCEYFSMSSKLFFENGKKFVFDEPCYLGIKFHDIFKNFHEIEESAGDSTYGSDFRLDPLTFESPYGGYTEYAEDSAFEDFENRAHDVIERIKELGAN